MGDEAAVSRSRTTEGECRRARGAAAGRTGIASRSMLGENGRRTGRREEGVREFGGVGLMRRLCGVRAGVSAGVLRLASTMLRWSVTVLLSLGRSS